MKPPFLRLADLLSAWMSVAGLILLAGATLSVASDYDAVFVRMTAPGQIMAHEVFAVTITMRNTGTHAWVGWPIRLRSINPTNNLTWGTDYLLIAQGTTVKSGDEYTFRSNLRAPGRLGPASFQWQISKDGALWLGQPTPIRTIDVIARPAAVAARTEAPPRKAGDKPTLTSADLEYVGSFKPPRTVQQARGAFSESGLALRAMPDGRDRLFMNYTHPLQVLFGT